MGEKSVVVFSEDSAGEVFSPQYLKSMLDALSDMIRVVTREGKIAFTNRAYDRNLAYRTDSVGSFCYELYGRDSICDPCITREVMDTGKMRQARRVLNGRTYIMRATPLLDEQGNTVAVLEIFRDVTLDSKVRDNLVKQTSNMQRDLRVARDVQRALVKTALPVTKGYELFADYAPCEAVGGDMYDVHVIDDKLVLYVADASGHGVTPSMLAVFFTRAVHAVTSMGVTNPVEILTYVQNEFTELSIEDQFYITGFVVTIDMPTGNYLYSNAGLSVVPIQYSVASDEILELDMESPPISRWFQEPEFGLAEGRLDPGDRLLLYSDGISELQTSPPALEMMYKMFSKDDFVCDEFVRSVYRDIRSHRTDDLTMLLCVREPTR